MLTTADQIYQLHQGIKDKKECNYEQLKVNTLKIGKSLGVELSTMQTSEKPRKINIFWLILSGIFIGFVNGFWGGGGGMICVPILTNLLKQSEKIIT